MDLWYLVNHIMKKDNYSWVGLVKVGPMHPVRPVVSVGYYFGPCHLNYGPNLFGDNFEDQTFFFVL